MIGILYENIKNTNLLLNTYLSGDSIKVVNEHFLMAHISIMNSAYFALYISDMCDFTKK